ncbi:MAG TPA: hypothetical protein VF169_09490 [Albitalea sp.]|uniref:hypothetical protein n=1 Tax=Piscinibacter sp. TaxID=1903157 RepID=UPI002ED538D5
MELHLHWPHRMQHQVDWPAAAVSGFAAGAVLMVLELAWAAAGGRSPWATSYNIAAIVMGRELLQSPVFSIGIVILALAIHYALGIVFGLLLGSLLSNYLPGWGPVEVTSVGAVFGLALYALDFYLLAPLFPWIAELRGGPAFMAHLVFGMSAALLYWKLQRRGAKR